PSEEVAVEAAAREGSRYAVGEGQAGRRHNETRRKDGPVGPFRLQWPHDEITEKDRRDRSPEEQLDRERELEEYHPRSSERPSASTPRPARSTRRIKDRPTTASAAATAITIATAAIA